LKLGFVSVVKKNKTLVTLSFEVLEISKDENFFFGHERTLVRQSADKKPMQWNF
jgi:hypothetical protein